MWLFSSNDSTCLCKLYTTCKDFLDNLYDAQSYLEGPGATEGAFSPEGWGKCILQYAPFLVHFKIDLYRERVRDVGAMFHFSFTQFGILWE